MPDSFTTPWAVAHQAPLFMGFSRQEYSSGLPFPSPGDLPDPGIEPTSPVSSIGRHILTPEPPGKPLGRRRTEQSTEAAELGQKRLWPQEG